MRCRNLPVCRAYCRSGFEDKRTAPLIIDFSSMIRDPRRLLSISDRRQASQKKTGHHKCSAPQTGYSSSVLISRFRFSVNSLISSTSFFKKNARTAIPAVATTSSTTNNLKRNTNNDLVNSITASNTFLPSFTQYGKNKPEK